MKRLRTNNTNNNKKRTHKTNTYAHKPHTTHTYTVYKHLAAWPLLRCDWLQIRHFLEQVAQTHKSMACACVCICVCVAMRLCGCLASACKDSIFIQYEKRADKLRTRSSAQRNGASLKFTQLNKANTIAPQPLAPKHNRCCPPPLSRLLKCRSSPFESSAFWQIAVFILI